MKALRNSGYRYLKYRVYALGYGILGVSDNAITLSLIIKNRENIIWKSFTILVLIPSRIAKLRFSISLLSLFR